MTSQEEFHTYFDEETGGLIVSEYGPAEVASYAGRFDRNVQRALASWAEDVQRSEPRNRKGLFGRDKYVTPGTMPKVLETAGAAVDDDIVSNVLDSSESTAFNKIHFEVHDKEQEDVWNQIARDLNLDGLIREMWRELFLYSQFYGIVEWGMEEYKVSGKTDKGNERRKKFNVWVPRRISLLDPIRVVPVNRDVFGFEQYAWIATPEQVENIDYSLFSHHYHPSESEKKELDKHEIPVDRLLLFRDDMIFYHSLTKSPYERWASVRMKSLFPILDLKEQLRDMDRSYLRAGVNFIVLVKRGTNEMPARPSEVEQATLQMRASSKSPVIVTDHRMEIEIITPDMSNVLDREKWDVLDHRLLMRLWMMFASPTDLGRDSSQSLSRVVVRGMASRRHMLKRVLEKEIIRPIIEHPLNVKAGFSEDARLQFTPRRMELEYDGAVIQMIQSLRDRGDLSRETILAEFGFDQELEAQRREYEDEEYSETFTPVNVPFDSKDGVTPDSSGRRGGHPNAPEKKPRVTNEGGDNNE